MHRELGYEEDLLSVKQLQQLQRIVDTIAMDVERRMLVARYEQSVDLIRVKNNE